MSCPPRSPPPARPPHPAGPDSAPFVPPLSGPQQTGPGVPRQKQECKTNLWGVQLGIPIHPPPSTYCRVLAAGPLRPSRQSDDGSAAPSTPKPRAGAPYLSLGAPEPPALARAPAREPAGRRRPAPRPAPAPAPDVLHLTWASAAPHMLKTPRHLSPGAYQGCRAEGNVAGGHSRFGSRWRSAAAGRGSRRRAPGVSGVGLRL